MTSFALVKFILSLMLSLILGGSIVADSHSTESRHETKNIAQCLITESSTTSALDFSFSRNSLTQSFSYRSANSSQQTSPQVKSSCRIVKCGKIIDNNRLHPFLTISFVRLSGIFISERYLYSICRLRL